MALPNGRLVDLKQIPSTGHVQQDVYNVVRNAFCPYRGIQVKTPVITPQQLIKDMQFDMYVKIVGEQIVEDNEKDAQGRPRTKREKLVIAILGRDEKESSPIATTTEKFRLFINSVKEPDAKIILISPCRFATHVLNYIHDNALGRRIQRCTYDHFKTVVPLGPGCSEHRIATADEVKKFLALHKLDTKEMKRIYTYDPQAIWLGAQPGDYVLIDRVNPLSGRSFDIRRVVRGEAPQ
jgi:DNA-directed RNA polymerase subunit H (RpoH/RPB5)